MQEPNRVAQAIERNSEEMRRYITAHTDGGAFEVRDGITLVSLPIPHALFNSVLIADVAEGCEAQAIQTATSFFAARFLPWNWTVGPVSTPAGLGNILLGHGFTHLFDSPGMALDLRSYKPVATPDVVEVHDEAGLRVWLEMASKGFGLPEAATTPFLELHKAIGWSDVPVRYFHILQGGQPVSWSMNFYGAGVTGIYCVATVPEARRQGLGLKVMHACLSAAIEDGYDTAVLHSSQMGLPLYENMGFTELCRLAYYAPPSATQT